jgi:hypothetical protein
MQVSVAGLGGLPMSSLDLRRAVRVVGRILLAAALLTLCVLGVQGLFEILTGIEVDAGTVTIVVPIMLVAEVSLARRLGRPSRVLGD